MPSPRPLSLIPAIKYEFIINGHLYLRLVVFSCLFFLGYGERWWTGESGGVGGEYDQTIALRAGIVIRSAGDAQPDGHTTVNHGFKVNSWYFSWNFHLIETLKTLIKLNWKPLHECFLNRLLLWRWNAYQVESLNANTILRSDSAKVMTNLIDGIFQTTEKTEQEYCIQFGNNIEFRFHLNC